MSNNIREIWFELIFEFSNLYLQNRLWVENSYSGLIGSFDEAICQYYDDLGLEDGYTNFLKEGIISKTEFEIIKSFHNALDNYTSQIEKKNLSDKNKIKDPDWAEVCKLAKSSWDNLKISINNNSDRNYLIGLEKKYL